MSYFDDVKKAREYIGMCTKPNQLLLDKIYERVERGSQILELGIGPGLELDVLRKDYQAIGTDYSEIFVSIYKEKHPNSLVFQMDAKDINIDDTFSLIYSNKVLNHLTDYELKNSLISQKEKLKKSGVLIHTIWAGSGEETFDGAYFNYHTKETIEELLDGELMIKECLYYDEFEHTDSLLLVFSRD